MIEFKEGAVCYAEGRQWACCGESEGHIYLECAGYGCLFLNPAFHRLDFQLNEPREGWYIPKSELDTEEKYNKAVEVFGLFGFKDSMSYEKHSTYGFSHVVISCGTIDSLNTSSAVNKHCKTKCTYAQLMAIGKLKRKMLEPEDNTTEFDNLVSGDARGGMVNVGPVLTIESAEDFRSAFDSQDFYGQEDKVGKSKRRNKSKQAYDILKSLDYEYDLVKQKWYKKEWV